MQPEGCGYRNRLVDENFYVFRIVADSQPNLNCSILRERLWALSFFLES
jgi:hypothetical protein